MARIRPPVRSTARPPLAKKRYRPPRLVKHGSLLHLTKVKGGNMNDGGGKPMTKSGGMNA